MTAKDRREFVQFLKQCTPQQVQGVYNKETKAGRKDYANLAVIEANRRNIYLDK